MKKNKMFIIASMVLTLGIVMLLGSSYSMINGEMTDAGYSFNVAEFNVEFLDSKSISVNGIPVTDEEGLKNSKEFTFTVSNKSNHDVNYKLDIIENSMDTMSEVIRYAYSLNDVSNNNIYTLSDNYTLNQNRVLKSGAKDVYKLKVWLSIDADERYMNKKFSATISLLATANDYKYATNVIEKLGNMNSDGVKKVENNYYYASKDSLNYVWFNCMDGYGKGEDYCEKWRIIGSFDNTMENVNTNYNMLKIMRDDAYSEVTYNNEELNGNYPNSYINTYANGMYYDMLNNQNKELIVKAKWNIGNTKGTNYSTSFNEEKTNIYYNYVGLLNVSDYLAINSNGWLDKVNDLVLLNKDDDMNYILNKMLIKENTSKELSFYPVVYLKPDVSILSGDGSINMPYELGIRYALNYGKNG